MATKEITGDIFDSLAKEITEIFDKLISQITTRRSCLLKDLEMRKAAFYEKLKTQNTGVQELEKVREQMKEMSLQNLNTDFVKSIESIDKQINDVNSEISPKLRFECCLIDISSKVQVLGSILESTKKSIYPQITKASYIFGQNNGKKKRDSCSPQYISSDQKGRVFVSNIDKVRIYRSSSEIQEIDDGMSPLAVTAYMSYIYVCCAVEANRYYIRKYNKDNLKIKATVSKTGGSKKWLNLPCSITLTPHGDILVADCNNNRVCVFDTNLYFMREFGIKILKKPTSIQTMDDKVYVLNNGRDYIEVFNLSGDYLKSILPCCSTRMKNPKSFCLDSEGNFIIADYGADTIKIFTPDGTLIHKIGREDPYTEDVSGCFGVVIDQSCLLVSCERLDCIKSFVLY